MTRDGCFNGLGALADQRLHGVKSQPQGAGLINLRVDMLIWSSGLEGPMQPFIELFAVYLKVSGSLVNANFKELLNFLVCKVGCLDEKVGQRRIAGDDFCRCCLAAERRQGAGELRWGDGVAADERDGGGLRAFAQDINQAIEQVAANCNQLGVGVVELGVALEREKELFLISKDALGVRRKRGLINLADNLFWGCADGAQSIQDKAAQL